VLRPGRPGKSKAGIADIHNGQADLRRDMRDLKEAQIATRDEIQAFAPRRDATGAGLCRDAA
jgi:hypothetical protein